MIDKILTILKYICVLLFIFSIGLNVYLLTRKTDNTIIKTVITEKIDTLREEVPVPKYEKEIKVIKDTLLQTRTVRDTLVQSIVNHDTVKVEVEIPITQKEYTNDSTYTAWVSGYRAQLDSIEVYNKTITINKETQIVKKPIITLSANVGMGYGLSQKKYDSFVGISIGIPLWSIYGKKKISSE